MTHLNFNVDMDLLKDSVLNSNMDAVVKSSVVLVLNAYMETERDEYLKAGRYERSAARVDQRNGYYERAYTVAVGKIRLRVPRTRSGEFSTTAFEKFARCDQALILAMLEMMINGVSTRKITNVVEQLCGENVSKSFVSSLTTRLDPIINEWAARPLNVIYYPYLFVDALYIKVREHNRVVSKAVYIATAINEQHQREILGLKVDHAESFESWQSFLQELKSRGLQSPKLIISDAHEGLRKAIQREFLGTSWQRCNVHFKRNIIEKLPKKDSEEFRFQLKRLFQAVTLEDMRRFKEELFDAFAGQAKFEKALAILDAGFEDTIQYMNEPVKLHVHIRSTNSLERLNQEVRRRERVIRIFPHTQSAFRLIGAVLMQQEQTHYSQKKSLTK